MTNAGRMPEGETLVNPYNLLEAVNSSSESAHAAWLIFLAVMAYLMVAVAGVTHKDLLLETPVSLPILQVQIQLTQFFQFAPVILVLFHLGLITQLVLVARKTLEFDHALRLIETGRRRTHPLRLELDNFFFVQAAAGPHRSYILSGFLHTSSWLTLIILPVVLILFIQIVFLPYHSEQITWAHRIALLADVTMLIFIGVFLVRAEPSFFQAFWRASVTHPLSFLLTVLMLASVTLFSLFIATVPGEPLDRAVQPFFAKKDPGTGEAIHAGGFALPVFVDKRGALFGLFQRHIQVTDTDLVPEKESSQGETTLNLRNRDLRFARLDRSDLHQADFTAANLDGASFEGTDLRGARLHCADVDRLQLGERAAAACVSAKQANFAKANLSGASMAGIDSRQAKFDEANLEGVDLQIAVLWGASFFKAQLNKADLSGGVQAQDASFLLASLQGADLTGAGLQFADFTQALLEGAVLERAHLEGASLLDADLSVAVLSEAFLMNANLSGAKISAADLRDARVWLSAPPPGDPAGLADFTGLRLEPPGEEERAYLENTLKAIEINKVREDTAYALGPLLNAGETEQWRNSSGEQGWQALLAAPQLVSALNYKERLTAHLIEAMCKSHRRNGALATGVARRAARDQFRGDSLSLYERLKDKSCPASATVLPRALQELAGKAASLQAE